MICRVVCQELKTRYSIFVLALQGPRSWGGGEERGVGGWARAPPPKKKNIFKIIKN